MLFSLHYDALVPEIKEVAMFSFKRFVTDLMLYRKAMLVSLLIFAAGVALGAANADTLTRLILSDLEKLGEYSRQLSQTKTPELHFFTFIFLNNALKSVAIMVLGGLLGIMPSVFLLMNGVALGYVVAAAASRGTCLGCDCTRTASSRHY